MTAPANFAFNDINELAKTPVLRNCGGLSRFCLRETDRFTAAASMTGAGNKPAKPASPAKLAKPAKPSPKTIELKNFAEFVGTPRRFTAVIGGRA